MTAAAIMIIIGASFVAGRLFEAARRVDRDLELAAEVWDDCNREHGTEAPNPYRTEA